MFKNIAVQLSANSGQFRQQMASASAAVKEFGAHTAGVAGKATRDFDKLEAKTKSLSQHLGGLKGALAGVGAIAAAGFGLKLASDLETSQVAFQGILGSAQEAGTFIKDLQQFAATTPFTFTGVQKSSQQLLALGHTADETIGILGVVGDAVSAVGGGEEQIGRVVTALAQMQGKGRMSAQELNQIAEALPNLQRVQVYDVLAEKLGKTRDEVAKLADQGEISAEQGIGALLEAMQNVPGAAGAMERQSRTLSGVMSTLKDQLQIAAGQGFGPLGQVIRDTVFPLLTQLGQLLSDVMVPVGRGLADVFRGLADAFAALAPHLAGLADAAGSLLSAFGSLIGPAAELLNMVLIPLVPTLQMLAGLLEGLLGIPGVTLAIQGLAIAFLAIQLTNVITTMGFFASMLVRVGAQAVATTGLLGGLRAAAISLQASLGPIGLAITGLIAIYAMFKPTAAGAVEVTDLFTEALKKQGAAADEGVKKIIATQIAEKDLMGALGAAGVSVADFAAGMMGGAKEAADFRNRLTALYESGAITESQFNKLYNGFNELGGTLDINKMKVTDLTAAERQLGIGGEEASEGQKALTKALMDMADPLAAYKEAQQQAGQAAQDASQKAVDAIHSRYDVAGRLLDEQERDERGAYDREVQARKDSLDKMLEAERDAIDQEHDVRLGALDARFKAEEDALDKEVRARKDSLDDMQRAEKDAVDDSIRNIKRLYDDRQEALDKTYEGQKEVLENRIKYTYGAEREQAIADLALLEGKHKEETRALEDQQDTEIDTLQDKWDDRWRQQDEALADEVQGLKDRLGEKETAEKDAEQLRYDNAKAAFDARATQQKTALDTEVADHKTHLDDKYRDLKQNLKDREDAEVTGEQNRRAKVKTEQDLTLAQYQTYLDDQLKKANKFNADLAVIASRGGADVIAEVAKLPPELVAQAAAAGGDALTKLLDSIRAALVAGKDVGAALGVPTTSGPGFIQGVGGRNLAYASGGITRGPMISDRAILWAEAGREAYIPFDGRYRSRATSILAETAGAFGYQLTRMANGGIMGGSSRGGGALTFAPNIHVDARVAAGVDPDAVGRAIAVQVERRVADAFLDLQRNVTVRAWRNG